MPLQQPVEGDPVEKGTQSEAKKDGGRNGKSPDTVNSISLFCSAALLLDLQARLCKALPMPSSRSWTAAR